MTLWAGALLTASGRAARDTKSRATHAASATIVAHAVGLSVLLAACAHRAPSSAPAEPHRIAPEVEASPRSAGTPPAPETEPHTALPEAPRPEPCGDFSCLRFGSAAAALAHVVEIDSPRVLGFGESHALVGTEHIASATARFASELLPVLAPTSSDLVVELLAPPSGCAPTTTERVEREEREVTSGQSANNQHEFVLLGHRARELGLVPQILRASCEDLDAIAAAGDEGVLVLMETIARLTSAEVERLLAQREEGRRVLAYGGALHNDPEPRAGRETWSYGPRLVEATGGSYTAVDLIVPEHIQDTSSWHALPWYEAAPRATADTAVLLALAPRSWVLFFPSGVPAAQRSE